MPQPVSRADGQFVSPSPDRCNRAISPGPLFPEAQTAHAARTFAGTDDGRPLRVVVIGQEYGHGPAHFTLRQRYELIHDDVGLERRYYKEPGHLSRNPHMRGATSALRLIFGGDLGADWGGEFLEIG